MSESEHIVRRSHSRSTVEHDVLGIPNARQAVKEALELLTGLESAIFSEVVYIGSRKSPLDVSRHTID
jgi:hypothetical protein